MTTTMEIVVKVNGAIAINITISRQEKTKMTSTILVVDDELLLERLLQLRFRKKIRDRQLEFVFAHNGREALEKLLSDRQFDMVLTDINMPEMDGFTFLEQLQAIDSHLPAVVMSADKDLTSMKTAMNRGAFDFVTKPIDFHALEVKISKTIEHVRQMKATMTAATVSEQSSVTSSFASVLDIPPLKQPRS